MSSDNPLRVALENIVKWLDDYTDHETLDSGRFKKPVELLRAARTALAGEAGGGDVHGFIETRIKMVEAQIAVEVLAGNTVKESNERSALAELYGVMDFLRTAPRPAEREKG